MRVSKHHYQISITHRLEEQPPKAKPVHDAVWLFLFLSASLQVAFWGGGFLGKFLIPGIELTNQIGFTAGSMTVLAILAAVGLNVAISGLVAGYSGAQLGKRLFV